MSMRLMFIVLPILIIGLPLNIYAQDMDEESMEGTSLTDKMWVGVNVGMSEPLGDPGTGGTFATGFAFKAFAQYDLSDKVKNLRVELSVGLSSWSEKAEGSTGSASVIPILVNGVYKLTDITSDISVFGYGGIGFNLHSWDTGDDGFNIVSQSNLGVNLGVGGSYPINPQMDLNLRVGYYLSLTSSLEVDVEGFGTLESEEDYGHAELPIMLGITYKL